MKLRTAATDQAERMVRLAWRIAHGEAVTRADIEREYGVSRATAKRDAALLRRVLSRIELQRGYQPMPLLTRPGARAVRLLD